MDIKFRAGKLWKAIVDAWNRTHRRWKRLTNLPPSMRRGFSGLAWSFFVSGVIIAAAYIWAIYHFSKYGDRDDLKALAVSSQRVMAFLDAVTAGIAAFLLLGAFAFIFSLRRPEEETIDDRVSYLYSARREESSASMRFLKDSVTLLGATVREARMVYSILQVSADKKLIKTTSIVEMDIVNMMMHDWYHQDMPLRIELTKIPWLDRDLGSIVYVRTTQCGADGKFESRVENETLPIRLTNNSPAYQREVSLKIPPAGACRYEYAWEGWAPIEELSFTGANRFAEKVIITWRNATDMKFQVRGPTADEAKGRSVRPVPDRELLPESEVQVVVEGLPPTEDVAFWIIPGVALPPQQPHLEEDQNDHSHGK